MRGELCSPLAGEASSPLSNPLVREPCRLTPCEARSYNRLAPYTCGTGAGSWAELSPLRRGGKSLKIVILAYTVRCIAVFAYHCICFQSCPKQQWYPLRTPPSRFLAILSIKLYRYTIQALKCLKSHSGRSHHTASFFCVRLLLSLIIVFHQLMRSDVAYKKKEVVRLCTTPYDFDILSV